MCNEWEVALEQGWPRAAGELLCWQEEWLVRGGMEACALQACVRGSAAAPSLCWLRAP